MGFKKLVSMNIAVIGNTAAAVRYATDFAAAGHDIYMATAAGETPRELHIPGNFDNIYFCTISDAAAIADLIIMATEPKDVREAAYWLDDVRRKVIIDVTANMNVPDDEYVRTVNAIAAITGSKHIVKMFDTAGYEAILRPLFHGACPDVVLLSDSKKAKEITKIMAKELSLSVFYDFGGSENLDLFNEMTRCWLKVKLGLKCSDELVKVIS